MAYVASVLTQKSLS